jgi:hypothetical protein
MRVLCILCLIHLGINFHAVAQKNQCLVNEGRKLLGIKETPGRNNRGPEVDRIVLAAGGKPGQAWCGWAQRYIHLKCACTAGGGMAASWFIRPHLLKTGWMAGDVFSVWNKYMNRIGHIGMVEQVLPGGKFIVTIEGNTNGFGSREGSGVCRLTRPVKQVFNYARWWQ